MAIRWHVSGAPAPNCVAETWQVNHGHHLFDNGDFVFFNNGGTITTPSLVREFTLNTSGSTMSATQVAVYQSSGNQHGDSLGDVQRLPNGNTLVTFSNNGLIQELDSSWNVVQTLQAPSTSGSFGYSDWRTTLYGPPERP